MRVKSDHYTFSINGLRRMPYPVQQFLMTPMYTIEAADRQHRVSEFR
jgi:hypothetical protein